MRLVHVSCAAMAWTLDSRHGQFITQLLGFLVPVPLYACCSSHIETLFSFVSWSTTAHFAPNLHLSLSLVTRNMTEYV